MLGLDGSTRTARNSLSLPDHLGVDEVPEGIDNREGSKQSLVAQIRNINLRCAFWCPRPVLEGYETDSGFIGVKEKHRENGQCSDQKNNSHGK